MSLGDSTDDTSNWKSQNKTLEREKMSSYHFFMVTLGYRLVLYGESRGESCRGSNPYLEPHTRASVSLRLPPLAGHCCA